ncbi:ABC transporter permease [Alkalihalobacillus pseudalcaliphilus]|uniref:ABC transporter permease n=1 Tax=Alkalihalobacillus pseudalcaliphilus TaxID=79884 RepID=UPI00064D8B31|nr:ABC transporter permease subunit [Alkalihalobacillus pseudalcaliphilus]KMK76372.1 ABC-type transport system involved in multi-copper enzyme maturation, permease component [Alkalihalobacillus pseudalcaliphilus]
MKSLLINPVLNKEFKLRFRSVKSYIGLAAYLLILGLLTFGIIYLQLENDRFGAFQSYQSQWMFIFLSMLQLALVIFITPGLTAGVISSEREKQTLPILLTTDQSSSSIILSKLISSVAFLLVIICSSLPLYMIVFLFGGISPRMLVLTFLMYIFTMVVIGAIGVFISTLVRKTIISMVTAYSLAFFLTGGMALLALISLNYSYMVTTQAFPLPYLISATNIPIMFFYLLEPGFMTELQRIAQMDLSPWILFFSFYGVIFVACLFVAIKKLRPKMKTKPLPQNEYNSRTQ